MFLCKQCQEQFEDDQLAYTLILESRVNFPASDLFVMKFCSKAHLQDFLHEISNQRQRYVLSKVTKDGTKQYEADYPLELLLFVGSSKAS